MEYKKIEEKAYNLHLIKSEKSKKISIKINIKEKINKETVTKRAMLSYILDEANKIYKTKRLLNIEAQELYLPRINIIQEKIGKFHFLSFINVFLNEKYTEEGLNEKTIKFFLNIINEPLVENQKFDEETFNMVKETTRNDINLFNENPNRQAKQELDNIVLKGTGGEISVVGYVDDLDKITPENLYQYYKKMIKDNIVDIFVVGNFEFDEMEKILKENLKFNSIKKKSESHIIEHKKTRKIVKKVVTEKNIPQSLLIIASKGINITDFERTYVLSVYNEILRTNLFKEVREKNSLCYSITSHFSALNSLELIQAGIDKNNFKKAITLIKKEIKKIEANDFTDELIEQAILGYKLALQEIEDSPEDILGLYQDYVYYNVDLVEERIKKIQTVTREDIIKVSKKIKLDTIYFQKGVKKHED